MIVYKMKLLIVILIIVVCPFKGATAQHIYQYTFFSTANGLPSNNLYKIVKDKKGFFWIELWREAGRRGRSHRPSSPPEFGFFERGAATGHSGSLETRTD